MVYPTGSTASSLKGLVQANYQPSAVPAGAPVQTTSVRVAQPEVQQPAPMNPMQAFVASLPMQQPVYQQAYQPPVMAQPQPSYLAQQIAANLNRPVTNTGDWMAANERNWQLQQEMRALNANLAPALNQAFYEATQAEANRRLRLADPNSMSAQIYSAVANNGSQMMVPGASFQLPTGDQQQNYLRQMGVTSPALQQMALDNDYLFNNVGRNGLYSSGSLGNWMANPIGYKSMGIEGRTPFKTYQDIDSPESLAYGGDGSQMAQQLQSELLRDFRWNQDAMNRYDQSMANKNPLGQFIGGGPNVVNTGVTGRVVGWNPSPSSGPAKNTGYGKGGGTSGMPDADWIDTPGDTWRYNKGDGFWEQDNGPDAVDPVNSKFVNDMTFRGRLEAEANQMRSRGVPEHQIKDYMDSFSSQLNSSGLMGLMSPAMGYATAPKIYAVPKQSKPKNPKDVTNSSGGFGGTLSPGWLDATTTYGPLFQPNYKERTYSRPADKLDASGILQGIFDGAWLRK